MTSKKQLRAEIERLTQKMGERWWRGFEFAASRSRDDAAFLTMGYGLPFDPSPWADHLARVADAAREEGRREGWSAAWAEGAHADEAKYDEGYARGWDACNAHAFPTPTPALEPAKPSADEVNRFSVRVWPDGRVTSADDACGCSCRCASVPTPATVWAPGSVTR